MNFKAATAQEAIAKIEKLSKLATFWATLLILILFHVIFLA